MDQELIKQLIQQVIEKSILENIAFYLLIFLVTLIATGASSFLVSYVKKRGEALATKEIFNEVLLQLEQSTEATEKVRSTILSQFSQEEERRRLIRDKLEELVELSYALELWLEDARTKALNGKSFSINSSPLAKLEMVLSIYFPELLPNFSHVNTAANEMTKWILGLHSEHLNSLESHKSPEFDLNGFNEPQSKLIKSLSIFRKELITRHCT